MVSSTLFLLLAQTASVMTASVSSPSHVCLTESCILQTAKLLQEMDRTVEPCQDFYQFACGGFMKRTSIPDDRTRMSSFSVLGDELLTQGWWNPFGFSVHASTPR